MSEILRTIPDAREVRRIAAIGAVVAAWDTLIARDINAKLSLLKNQLMTQNLRHHSYKGSPVELADKIKDCTIALTRLHYILDDFLEKEPDRLLEGLEDEHT